MKLLLDCKVPAPCRKACFVAICVWQLHFYSRCDSESFQP